MSLQLIYTSAELLLDSGQPGYGIVARSEVMPREMRRKLAELSRYRTVAGSRGNEIQCAYTTLTHARTEYHVLSVSQPAGADYSGRLCHISHHLVLLPEEVSALIRNRHRPTPAGIILALGLHGFWCRKWSSPPSFIKGEPALRPEDIPEASTQATWKRLTGHKSNARAFSVPPFERDCLMTVPEGITFIDILKLWHESDWLMPHCGWGKTFITHPDESDNFRITQRWASDEKSPLIRRAMRTGHPVLPIGEDLEIGELSNAPQPATAVISPLSVSTEEQKQFLDSLAARQAARIIPPYQYSEEPDEEIFDLSAIRKKRTRRIATFAATATLLLGGGIIGSTVYYINRTPAHIGSNVAFRALKALINKPYHADYAAKELEKAEALARASGTASGEQNKVVIRIIDILQQASESEKHAANLRMLCRLAKQWNLNKTRLCLLYLNEATHNRPTDDWFMSFSRDELNEWERLIADEPELRQGLNEPGLLAYFDKVMNKQAATDSPPRTDKDVSKGTGCTGRFIPVTVNDELPEEFMQLLAAAPVSLTQGELVIIRRPESVGEDAPFNIPLHPETSICNIVRSAAADYYHLRFAAPTGTAGSSYQDIDLCIRNNRLISISCGGNPIGIYLPLPSSSGLLLLPRLSIPLSGIHMPKLPPATELDFSISPEQLELLPPSSSHMAVSLKLNKNEGFPWEASDTPAQTQRFSFSLPRLHKDNAIHEPEISPSNPIPIIWNGVKIKENDETTTTFTCALTPQTDMRELLMQSFNKLVNTACAGEVSDADPMFSLAMIYTTLRLMDKEDMTEKEWESATTRYCTLFNNKTFSELMRRIAPNSTSVLLPHETAGSRSAAGKTARRQVLKRLQKPATRQQLQSSILRYISLRLHDTYEELREQFSADTELRLILRHLSCENNQVIWHFILQTAEESHTSSTKP